MALEIGSRLGHYDVTALIGEGGMGQVYQATDTKLNRQVALKILPEAFASDPDRLARFQREAQVLASLNHPNIAAIHGLEDSEGTKALVLELVEGPTLADRIAQGPIPVDEALPIAKQIAEALEAAHEQGVIHRDLKPANIKVRQDGTVKVLDFGLAKALDTTPEGDPSQSPTLTAAATQMGVILGTAAYMSPEQARGKPVDKRADVWAFGAVLYEMLAGERLFQGEDTSELLAMVIRDEPSLQRVPSRLQRLLRKCLAKDPKQRLRDIGDAWELIEPLPSGQPVTSGSARRPGVAWLAAGVLLVALAGLSYLHFGEVSPVLEQVRFAVAGPAGEQVDALSLSPDGRHVAFVARNSDGENQVWVRTLETLEARALAGTEGVTRSGLFWSPDSRFIGFASERRLMKIQLDGTPPQTVCDLEGDRSGRFLGGTWNSDGVIVFGGRRGLMQVPESGGTPFLVTEPRGGGFFGFDGYPFFLPDGRHFVYLRRSTDPEVTGIYLGLVDMDPQEQSSERILASVSAPIFAPTPEGPRPSRSGDPSGGYLLFDGEGSLMAQPFDINGLAVSGEAVPVAGDLTSGNESAIGHRYSVSSTGVLVYRSGGAEAGHSRLIWYDRQGNQVGQVGSADAYVGVHLTPDEKYVLVATGQIAGVRHSLLGDLERNFFTRVIPGDIPEYGAVASTDGRVAVTLVPDGVVGDIYAGVLNETGPPEVWVENTNVKHPSDFSPDGRFLIYDEHHPTQKQDLWVLPIGEEGKPSGEPTPFLTTAADESFGRFSPDGEWIAYYSDDSGQREVFVQGFSPERAPPFSTRRWQVSTTGGDKPRWSHDGAELYYVSPDGYMMAVPVETNPDFQPGVPMPLFKVSRMAQVFNAYDVSADGRFLIISAGGSAEESAAPITVVMNWIAGR